MANIVLETRPVGSVEGDFFVKSYQRGYRWGKEEVIRLLEDIYSNGSGKNYYLQPIVIRREDNRFELIDGQQRLTTISLFMAAIYTRLKEYKDFMDEDDEDVLPALRKSLKSGLSPNEMK